MKPIQSIKKKQIENGEGDGHQENDIISEFRKGMKEFEIVLEGWENLRGRLEKKKKKWETGVRNMLQKSPDAFENLRIYFATQAQLKQKCLQMWANQLSDVGEVYCKLLSKDEKLSTPVSHIEDIHNLCQKVLRDSELDRTMGYRAPGKRSIKRITQKRLWMLKDTTAAELSLFRDQCEVVSEDRKEIAIQNDLRSVDFQRVLNGKRVVDSLISELFLFKEREERSAQDIDMVLQTKLSQILLFRQLDPEMASLFGLGELMNTIEQISKEDKKTGLEKMKKLIVQQQLKENVHEKTKDRMTEIVEDEIEAKNYALYQWKQFHEMLKCRVCEVQRGFDNICALMAKIKREERKLQELASQSKKRKNFKQPPFLPKTKTSTQHRTGYEFPHDNFYISDESTDEEEMSKKKPPPVPPVKRMHESSSEDLDIEDDVFGIRSKYKCPRCEMSFTDRELLDEHFHTLCKYRPRV